MAIRIRTWNYQEQIQLVATGHNLNSGPLDYKYITLTTQPHKLPVSFNEGKGKISRGGSFNSGATHSSAQLHTLNCSIKILFLPISNDISYVCQRQYIVYYTASLRYDVHATRPTASAYTIHFIYRKDILMATRRYIVQNFSSRVENISK